MNSTGSAMEEQERYLNSIQGKTELLNSAFQQLSSSTIDSGFIKFLIDAGTAIVKLVDNVGLLNIAFGTFFAAVAVKKGLTLNGMFKEAGVYASTLISKIKATSVALTSQQQTYVQLLTLSKQRTLTETERVLLSKTEIALQEVDKKNGTYLLAQAKALVAQQRVYNTLKAIGNGLLVGMGASFAMMAASELWGKFEESLHPLEQAEENLNKQQTKLEEIQSEYDTLKEKSDRTKEEESNLKLLEQQLNVQKELVKSTEQQKYDSTLSGTENPFAGMWHGMLGGFDAIRGDTIGYAENAKQIGEWEDGLRVITERYEELKGTIKDYEGIVADATTADKYAGIEKLGFVDALKEAKDEQLKNIEYLQMAQTELTGYGDKLSEDEQELLKLITAITDADEVTSNLAESTNEANSVLDNLGDSTETISGTFETFKDGVDLITTAYEEMNNQGYLSIDTVMSMIEAGGQYLDLLTLENGQYTMNADAMAQLFEMKKADAIAELEQKKAVSQAVLEFMEAEVAAYEISGKANKSRTEDNKTVALAALNTVYTSSASIMQMLNATGEGALKAIKANAEDLISSFDGISNNKELAQYKNVISSLKGSIKQYDTAINVLANQTLPSYTSAMKGAGKATGGAKDKTDALKSSVDALKDSLDAAKNELKDMEDAYKAMQNAIVNQLEKEIGLENEKLDALKKQKEYYEAMQDVAGDIIDEQIKKIQDEIDALDDEKEKQDEILALQEAQLNAQKARDAYEQSKSNKNTRVYNEGKMMPLTNYIGQSVGVQETEERFILT